MLYPAEHFEFFKMLLCPKALINKAFCGGLLYREAGLAPSRTPATFLALVLSLY